MTTESTNDEFEVNADEKALLERIRLSKLSPNQAAELMKAGARGVAWPAPSPDDSQQRSTDSESVVTRGDLDATAAQLEKKVTRALENVEARKSIDERIRAVIVKDGTYAHRPGKIRSIQAEVAVALRERKELGALSDEQFLEAVTAETEAILKADHDDHHKSSEVKSKAETDEAAKKAEKTGERSEGGKSPSSQVAGTAADQFGAPRVVDERSMDFGTSQEWPKSDAEVMTVTSQQAQRFLAERSAMSE